MEKIDFDFEERPFEGLDDIKEMLVSEINVIRDIMGLAAIFVGQPLHVGVKLLQEMEPDKNK